MTTIMFTLKIELQIGETKVSPDGAIVFIYDSNGVCWGFRFVNSSGVCIFDLDGGTYTIVAAINLASDGTPIETVEVKTVVVSSIKNETTLTIIRPDDKGDIKAIVKVDGTFQSGDKVTIEQGSFKRVLHTDGHGEALFTGLQGLYSVTACAVRTCTNGTRSECQTIYDVDVPADPSVTVPVPFFLWLCQSQP